MWTSSTKCGYTWDPTGRLSQSACGGGGAPADEGDDTGENPKVVELLAALQGMMDRIDDLERKGSLNKGQAGAVKTKLSGAIDAVGKQDPELGINSLETFVNHMNALTNDRILQEDESQPLIDDANGLIEDLATGF